MSQFWKKYVERKVVECKPDRNRPADLTRNREPDGNQTADLTKEPKTGQQQTEFFRNRPFSTAMM